MTVRIAAVGLGGLARIQLSVLGDLEGVAVVAGADVDPAAREAFAAEHDAPAYESHDEMLAAHADGLDAVNVVTPHTLHHEQVVAALERDLHVHVEKPMVTTVADAVDVVDLAAERDRVLQVGYQRHFHPAYREVRRLLRSGRVGDVHAVSCYLGQDWIEGQAGTWRTDPDLSGGGQLIDSGSHLLDALLWMTDSRAETVAAVADGWADDPAVDVNTALAARLSGPDGETITASVAVSGDGTGMEEGFVVWGTDGHVEYSGDEIAVTEQGGPGYSATVTGEGVEAENRTKLDAFLAAVRGERDVAVPGEYGLRVTELTEAAYRAAESGETVDVASLRAAARDQ